MLYRWKTEGIQLNINISKKLMSLEIETEKLDHSAKQQSEAYFQINDEAGLKDKSFKWFLKYSNIMKDLCKDFQHIIYERRFSHISKPEG